MQRNEMCSGVWDCVGVGTHFSVLVHAAPCAAKPNKLMALVSNTQDTPWGDEKIPYPIMVQILLQSSRKKSDGMPNILRLSFGHS